MEKQEISQETKEQWAQEAVQLENIINTSEFAGRIVARASGYVVFLYGASTDELIMCVASVLDWQRVVKLFGVMVTPGDAEIEAMAYDSHAWYDQNGALVHDGGVYSVDAGGDLVEIETIERINPSEY